MIERHREHSGMHLETPIGLVHRSDRVSNLGARDRLRSGSASQCDQRTQRLAGVAQGLTKVN